MAEIELLKCGKKMNKIDDNLLQVLAGRDAQQIAQQRQEKKGLIEYHILRKTANSRLLTM